MRATHYVFNHIEKTGGTSLLSVCRQNLQSDEVSPHLADFDIRFRPVTAFEDYRLIVGHFSLLTQMGFGRNRFSITMLRDPVQRILSLYRYYRITSEGTLVRQKARELSFAEFVRYFQDSPVVARNAYCHHFAAMGSDFNQFPDDPEALLAVAKHNLAAFDCIGISEEFERSARLLCRELGWRAPERMPHENESSSESRIGPIDAETLVWLHGRNQLDYELYEYARQLFAEREAAAYNGAIAAPDGELERNRFVPLQAPLNVTRRARFRSFSTYWVPKERSQLRVDLEFTTTAPMDLDLGLAITDSGGNIVWVGNTEDGNLVLKYGEGLVTHVSFVFECVLPAGAYSIVLGMRDQRRIGFNEHWIEHAMTFKVSPQQAADGRAHYIRLMQFESAVSSAWAARSDLRRWRHATATQEREHLPWNPPMATGIRALSFSRESSNAAPQFRPQAVLDKDTKLARPRVRLELAREGADTHSETRRRLLIAVTNLGDETLSSRYTFPVRLSYHWLDDDHSLVQQDGLRSNLICDILPGDTSTHEVVVGPPPGPSATTLCVTLVQENVCWFDGADEGNRLLLHSRELESMRRREPVGTAV